MDHWWNGSCGMASAMKKAVEAGRDAFLAGRMKKQATYNANPSSPINNTLIKNKVA